MVTEIIDKGGLKNDLYEVDREVVKRGYSILRLPPYGCDLNVIELSNHDLILIAFCYIKYWSTIQFWSHVGLYGK